MIFCVVRRELEADLFDPLAGGTDERRLVRERRRARIPGTFPRTDADSYPR